MKLWLISQDANGGYDTYDSAVVAAPDEDSARLISPSPCYGWKDGAWHFLYADGRTDPERRHSSWALPGEVNVELIGEGPHDAGKVICASFNAG